MRLLFNNSEVAVPENALILDSVEMGEDKITYHKLVYLNSKHTYDFVVAGDFKIESDICN